MPNKNTHAELIRRIKVGPGPGTETQSIIQDTAKLLMPCIDKLPVNAEERVIYNARVDIYHWLKLGAHLEACDMIRQTVLPTWGLTITDVAAQRADPRRRRKFSVTLTPVDLSRNALGAKDSWPRARNTELPRAYIHAIILATR